MAEREVEYHRVAAAIMKDEGVAPNDLRAFARPRVGALQRPKNAPFTPAGIEQPSGKVTALIEAALAR